MSTDNPTKFSSSNPIINTFVIIGGWASSEDWSKSDATPMPPTAAYSASADLLRRVQSSELSLPPGQDKVAIGLKGRMMDIDVDKALDFIKDKFDPRGKLIIHGHSMGGAAVLRLCRKIDREIPFYGGPTGFTTQAAYADATQPNWAYQWSEPPKVPTPPPIQKMTPPSDSPLPQANATVRVDLLVTVDAAIGNLSQNLNRSVGRCVRTNLNYYQTTRKGVEKSFGGPNRALAPTKTIVWNHDLTNRMLPSPDPSKPSQTPDHYSIQAQLNNLIMKIFQEALKVNQVTDFWNP
jgi:hypothetical protein